MRTDRQTYRHADRNTSHQYRGLSNILELVVLSIHLVDLLMS